MSETRSRRLALVAAVVACFAVVGVLATGRIGENIVYFWEPTEVLSQGNAAVGATIRMGGVVKAGSVDWNPDTQTLWFEATDLGGGVVRVHATGAPPQMFREGIGVVVEGTMTREGVFETDRLMVKHSNEYKAPVDGVDPKDLYLTLEEGS